MGRCPFCQESVERDILVNGGRCPHCLIEIPGEEAATDPGEDALARQAEEEEAARRSPGPLIAAAALLVALVGGGAFVMMGDEPAAVAVGESGAEIYKKVGSEGLRKIVLDDEPAEVVDPVPTKASPGRSPTTTAVAKAAPVAPVADGGPEAPPPLREPGADGGAAPTKTAAILPGGGAAGGPTASLSDPLGGLGGPGKKGPGRKEACGDQIREVLNVNMGTLRRQMNRCEADATKRGVTIPTMVEATMVITRTGKVSDVSLRVGGEREADFESCVLKAARTYSFPPFCEDLEVSKAFRFGS